jgi:preprotein translocase subunit SecB
MKNAKIQLKKILFPQEYLLVEHYEDNNNISLNVTVNKKVFFDEDDTKQFKVTIEVLANTNTGVKVRVLCVGVFSVDGEIDEEFKNSDFVNLNAPAILYPFVRSFITNISTNSGFSPIIIPAVNFSEAKKKDNTDK